jgi:hypothetical protein
VYIRLRKETYTDIALGEWACRLRELSSPASEVLCYVRHDDNAPRLALRLKELVG